MGMRDWLQLWRSHTSPLEVSFAVAGAVLHIGSLLDWRVALWALFGWLYHNAGYGQNSVEDFAQGFDQGDPNKAGHPLQRGSITLRTARTGTYGLMALTAAYALVLSRADPTALAILALLVSMGVLYNLRGKGMRSKFLPIALAHSLILPFAYVGSGGRIEWSDLGRWGTDSFLLLTAFLALLLQITYQIMVEGDVKDAGRDEATLLDRLGVRLCSGRLESGAGSRAFSLALKSANVTLAALLAFELGSWPLALGVGALFGPPLLFLDRRLLAPGPFDHAGRVRTMALIEVGSTFMLLAACAPAMAPLPWGVLAALGLMAALILYFVAMNRYLWGTVVRPRV